MLTLLLASSALVALTAYKGVRVVPQSQNWVVTRLGAHHSTLDSGLNFIVPFFDKVHSKVPVNDQVLNDLKLEVVSSDNVVYVVQLLAVYKITDAARAVFRVNSVQRLVIGLVQSLARAELGAVELDSVQKDRASLNASLQSALEQAGETYGIQITRVEITDVQLNERTQKAMSEVLAAERERRAAILRAEGQRKATELAADAELYEAERRADAIRAIATANAEANKTIAASLEGEAAQRALTFQTARMQVEALEGVAKSTNAKLVMLPGGASNALMDAAAVMSAGGFK
mgnify:CR=1 FL=1